MEPAEIETLLQWIDPKRKPVVVQLPADAYARVMKQWGLPEVVALPAK